LDNAPKRIVVDAKVAVYQAVAGSDDEAPGDLRMGRARGIGNVRRRLADEFQVADGCILVEPTGDKPRLVEAIRVGQHLLGEGDHVVYVKPPFALGGIRRARRPFR
jgi:hypothetical protein